MGGMKDSAILGIQNWNRDDAHWAPGRTATAWVRIAHPTALFHPAAHQGFVSSRMYTYSGTLVATADTLPLHPVYSISASSISVPRDTTRYEVRTIFSTCDPAVQFISLDTITTIKNNDLGATATSTNSSCGPPREPLLSLFLRCRHCTVYYVLMEVSFTGELHMHFQQHCSRPAPGCCNRCKRRRRMPPPPLILP